MTIPAGKSVGEIIVNIKNDIKVEKEECFSVKLGSHRATPCESTATGRGWFVDWSPWDDDEFLRSRARDELQARRGGAADDHADLLTTVMHELGHELGLPDVSGLGEHDDLMNVAIGLGQLRLPAPRYQ